MKYVLGIIVGVLGYIWFTYSPDGPVSYVEVEFVAPDDHVPLYSVSITSGGDKSALGNISPGETQSTRIYPKDATDNELHVWANLRADQQPTQVGWVGQRYYPPGTAFRTHIQIDQNGKVIAEKSCKLPCSFD
ncbi:hypothetical protein QCD60_05790 [Pokkaliibacter sp. MBI-7]|uniref:hypothetical protein n=1 Tax=Pokkaliibacter sp. MBI-7 TaxID=3040600 RepID=UPI002447108C|nr:hypothetical protein [Pokkaliibacter sp. MBI-7]MDH2432066.1 hypothetical protein [Pokkaliibacter sp. MBI-7]